LKLEDYSVDCILWIVFDAASARTKLRGLCGTRCWGASPSGGNHTELFSQRNRRGSSSE